MMTQKFSMEKPKLIKIVICLLIVAIFWVMPAPAPMTTAGIRVIGVFISTVILLSAVDTVWPAMLAGVVKNWRYNVKRRNQWKSWKLGGILCPDDFYYDSCAE